MEPPTNHMRDQDKATSTIPQSPAQNFISKVDRRDKLVRVIEVTFLLALAIFSTFLALRLQFVIEQNEMESKARSAAAQRDREETKDYIKCILLVRFDYPPEQLATRDGAEKALIECAKKTKAPDGGDPTKPSEPTSSVDTQPNNRTSNVMPANTPSVASNSPAPRPNGTSPSPQNSTPPPANTPPPAEEQQPPPPPPPPQPSVIEQTINNVTKTVSDIIGAVL